MANIEISTLTRNNDGNTYIIKDANAIPRSGGAVLGGMNYSRTVDNSALNLYGGTSWTNGAQLQLFGKNWTDPGAFVLYATLDANNRSMFRGKPDGTLTWNNKNLAMQEDTVPRSGGAVISSNNLGRIDNTGYLVVSGGRNQDDGSFISFAGKYASTGSGNILIGVNGDGYKTMNLFANGTWTWTGTACQITSDARLKQQISEIDDKLLTAWEDVDLVQFKYNDAVNEKGDKARLHTGYVVQQIDEACKKHNVDISAYGLYCHEEYEEETREVENDDGTKTTEVVRPASEHYSLRYTETLVVECAYLRRENDKLKQQFKQLEKTVNELKSIINCSEFPNS